MRGDFHVKDFAVPALMPPVPAKCQFRFALAYCLEHPGYLLRRTNIGEAHAQEFLAGISILVERGAVYIQEEQSLWVVNHHRLGIIRKQKRRIYFSGISASRAGVIPVARRRRFLSLRRAGRAIRYARRRRFSRLRRAGRAARGV